MILLCPRLDDGVDRALPHILDCAEPEPDPAVHHFEIEAALVDVGRKNLDSHLPAVVDELDDLLRAPDFPRRASPP